MAIPAAKVETRIVLSGQNNASKPIKEAHKDLRDMAGGAKDMGKSLEASTKAVQDTSGDLESSLGSLKDFLPGISDELNGVAQAGGALESVLRLIPGPIGGAIAATAALGIAIYSLANASRESAAAVALLGDAATEGLADRLGISTKEAAGLQNQMRQLPEALRPSADLLELVGKNAESLGGEPVEAQKALVAALIYGGDSIRDFESTYGKLPVAIGSVADAVRAAGLDPEMLGVGPKAKSLTEQATAATLARAKAENEVSLAMDKVLVARRNARTATGAVDKATTQLDLKAAREELAARQAAFGAAEVAATVLGEKVKLNAAFNDSLEQSDSKLADIADTEEGRARNQATILALQERQKIIQGQLAELEKQRLVLGEDAYKAELKRLQDLGKEAERGIKSAGKDTEKLEKDADTKRAQRAAKAASESKRRRDEERQSLLSTNKAREALMLAQLEADPESQAAAVRAKAYTEVLDVLRDTKKSAEEKAALVKGITLKRDQDLETMATTAEAKSAALRQGAVDADLDLAAQRRQIAIDSARDAGDEETAVGLEKIAIAEQLKRDLYALEAQANIDRKGLYGEDLKAFESALLSRKAKVTEAASSQTSKLGKPKAFDPSEIIVGVDRAMGAIDQVSGKAGKGLLAAAQGAKSVAGSWKETKDRAPAMIGAVGGVAAAVVSGQRQQAAVLALMNLAQGTALAFVPGKQAEAAGSFAAAAIYGAVAGGLGSGGSGGGGRPSGGGGQGYGGGGAQGPGFGQQGFGGQSNGGPQTINVFYGMLGTKQEAGLLANKALTSLRGTGFGQ